MSDVDGNVYIDFMLGLGPVILEHRPPRVLAAVERALRDAVTYGAQHRAEAELAQALVDVVPGVESVALATTGSEAVHFAVRVARARTGRRRIVKFDGHYHGWLDPVFVNTPWSRPVETSPASASHSVAGQEPPPDVTVTRWGQLEELERALAEGPPVAAVLMEPIPCNFGTIAPPPGYLEGVRSLCSEHGAMLVFDEVLTGFRVALGGAQERLGVQADLVVFSKAVASGFPLAVVGGTRDALAPAIDGPVRPAGTFSGFPASVAAALATIGELRERSQDVYPRLERLGARLASAIEASAERVGVPLTVNRVGSVLQLFWGAGGPVRSYAAARRDDRAAVARLSGRLLAHGLHVPERGLLLLCAAHTDQDMAAAAAAFDSALRECAGTDI